MTTENKVNLFEAGIRAKLRFSSPQGVLTVEDLLDLPLTSTANRANLDDIAKDLHAQIQASNDKVVSFVKPSPKKSDYTQLKFDLVMLILNEKMAARDAAEIAAEKAAKKQKLMALIDQKQNDALAGQSVEELQKLLADL
jgi:hypothetical protein